MSEIFSIHRFGLFLRQYLYLNRKKLLQSVLAFIGVSLLFCNGIPYLNDYYMEWSPVDEMLDKELMMFWWFLFVIVIVFGANMFITLDSKLKRESELTLPASETEKYATYFLVNIIGAWILFLAAFLIGDCSRVLFANLYADPQATIHPLSLSYFFSLGHEAGNGIDDIATHSSDVGYIILANMSIFSVLILQSFFALVSSVWPKNSFRKGMLAGICIIIATSLFTWFGTTCFPIPVPSKHFEGISDLIGGDTLRILSWISVIFTIVANYAIAYLRFREQETIERW